MIAALYTLVTAPTTNAKRASKLKAAPRCPREAAADSPEGATTPTEL